MNRLRASSSRSDSPRWDGSVPARPPPCGTAQRPEPEARDGEDPGAWLRNRRESANRADLLVPVGRQRGVGKSGVSSFCRGEAGPPFASTAPPSRPPPRARPPWRSPWGEIGVSSFRRREPLPSSAATAPLSPARPPFAISSYRCSTSPIDCSKMCPRISTSINFGAVPAAISSSSTGGRYS